MDLDKKDFIVHIAFFSTKIIIYLIQEIQIALLITEKVIILEKYSDFTNVFLKQLVVELFKRFNINNHAINLEPDK